MGNHVVVMDSARNVIGEMNMSIACFMIVNKIVEKYNEEPLPFFGDVNAALDGVYDKCKRWEEVQLLAFINDKSVFYDTDIPALDEAISRYDNANEGPKRHLEFIRGLLGTHRKLLTEYSGVSTMAMTVKQA